VKKKNKTDFITVTLFFGILLSFFVYISIGSIFMEQSSPKRTKDSASPNLLVQFNAVLTQDESIKSIVDNLDYRLFRHVSDPNVLLGKHNWLFEIEADESSYNYLKDYTGGMPYTEEEMAYFSECLAQRKAAYADKGADYLLVVIPNSLSVCNEAVPRYLGEQSENTRLRRLSEYLKNDGTDCFLNLEQALEAQGGTALYHNTEDSLNARGAFFVYDSTMQVLDSDSYDSERVLALDDVEFSTRTTVGRRIAKRIGMEKTIRNRTVSLTDILINRYTVSTKRLYDLTSYGTEPAEDNRAEIILAFSRDWDKQQLMPYFSNTFDTAAYQSGLEWNAYLLDRIQPKTVIQFIHESELDMIMQEIYAGPYRRHANSIADNHP